MRTIAVILLAAVAVGCAARIPSPETFNAGAWTAVEAIAPGARVEVRYVTGNPPLRHTFEGTFRSATPAHLEIETPAGRQRLLASRVLRVEVGGRESRVLPLAALGVLVGSLIGGIANIDPPNDGVVKRNTLIGALAGGLVAAAAATRQRDAVPRVVYVRSDSL